MSTFDLRKAKLSDLIDMWFKTHGHTLKDSKYRVARLYAMSERMGNPLLRKFNTSVFANYRAERVGEVSTSTVNHELRYLRAVFNEMDRLGFYEVENPLKKIRQFKEMEKEMGFLEDYQIPILLEACADSRNKHLTTVVKICLSTGARFGEAEYLTRNELVASEQPCLRFSNTKNGKIRTVPISHSLFNEIKAISNSTTERRFFSNCRTAFRKAADRSGIEFPQGQKTHILRHTFASHFMMNGGDILTLQKVLGHSDLKITLRYSHLSPDYLTKVLELNPLINCKIPERAKVVGLFEGLSM